MKSNIIIALLTICMLQSTTPCIGQNSWLKILGNNERIKASSKTITYEIENPEMFDQILLSGSGYVEYRQSTDGQTRVKVTISENMTEYITVEVVNGELRNREKKENLIINGDFKLRIVAESPRLKYASVAGSGEIELKGNIAVRKMSLQIAGSGIIKAPLIECKESLQSKVAGSGQIYVEGNSQYTHFSIAGSGKIQTTGIETDEMNAEIAGSGQIHLKGNTAKASYKTTGSGDIHAGNMKAEYVNAKVTGSGRIHCYVTGTLDTKITGSGEINYSGNPTTVNSQNKVKKTEEPVIDKESGMEGI